MTDVFVGCDDGYAEIKLSYLDDAGAIQYISFPSRIALGSMTSDVQGNASARAYQTNGHQFQVLPPFDAIDTRFDSYPISDANRVLVYHAMREAHLQGKVVGLCTGLPAGVYFSGQAGINDRLISSKIDSLKKPVRSIREATEDPVRIGDCHVCPEGVAAAFDHMFGLDGSIVNPLVGAWGVVDIGGRTTDVVTVVWDGAVEIDRRRTGSLDVGVMKAVDLVAKRIADEFDVADNDIGGIEHVMRTGKIRLYGREHDVSKHVAAASSQVGAEIIQFVQQKLGSGARMEKVIFVGGGAECFRSVLGAYRASFIPELPQMANSRGMLKYALLNGD